MANSASIEGYLHFEGYDSLPRDIFDKKKIRAGMRKAGRLVMQRAQMNLALARDDEGYPVNRSGATLHSISFRVSKSGFLVRVAPKKTSAMKEYYPAYLFYGVKRGARLSRLRAGEKHTAKRRRDGIRLREARSNNDWLIAPRDNYMADALQDSNSEVQAILSAAFAVALS
ncbi:hypothetical protein GHO45_10725 [Pseudomonas sp. FSL R10-0765]|uniref:hypothetical protein n=1 Tax=Pseudomonas sp. FSL R10-0765 TaxID=2662195 RepID=UPI00129666A1|nr:hypothetical protein [Pseudomonas sp. FSL R10-0765]MQT41396.1 hypothetical protein [Pseudomonas sp. FSL R10-0765]